jgi:predicted nicotinamide N-methyase
LKAGAATATACDIEAFCQAAVALNARANGVSVRFAKVDAFQRDPPTVDVVCAGDLCYEKPLAERALAWLAQAHAQGARVLLGDPGRTYFPKTGLAKLAEHRVPTTRELEDSEIKRTAVWTFPP